MARPDQVANLTLKTVATACVQLKAELGRLGLLKTMHAMDIVVKGVGWELIELEEN